jgi:hypothetical protein
MDLKKRWLSNAEEVGVLSENPKWHRKERRYNQCVIPGKFSLHFGRIGSYD